MWNKNFSNENLAKHDPYKAILKMSAEENGKKYILLYNAASNCPNTHLIVTNSSLQLFPNDLGHKVFAVAL